MLDELSSVSSFTLLVGSTHDKQLSFPIPLQVRHEAWHAKNFG
jgi:hypothetical protein